ELEGVDIEDLDDEALARITVMLEAFDAERAGLTVPPSSELGQEIVEFVASGVPILEEAETNETLSSGNLSRELHDLQPETEGLDVDWALLTDIGSAVRAPAIQERSED